MTKSTGVGRGGYRKGARRPKLDEKLKRVKYIISLQAGRIADFETATGDAETAKKQIEAWVCAYTVASNETDRLLAASPTAIKLLRYLKATNAPDELREELESLIVQQVSDKVNIGDGVIKTQSGAFVI